MLRKTLLGVVLHLCMILSVEAQISWKKELTGIGTFSSPRITDLNGDGHGDIILGAGREEFKSCDSAVFALDGTNGKMLWKISAQDQIFGSATLHDITGDGISDVFICGRSAELKAINGATGKLIWAFWTEDSVGKPAESGWYNFYNPQFIPDQNEDGQMDVLVSNGGDVLVEPYDPNRPAGSLLILDAKNGKLISKAQMPDGRETYMSIIATENMNGDDYNVVFGTGGETIGGHLYVAQLSDIRSGDLSDAKELASSPDKGFIAPPVWADITKDGILDIIVSAVDGRVMAFNGRNWESIWKVSMPNTEIYSSLGVGYFTEDSVLDFFASVAQGVWPELEWNRQFMVDGAKGEIVFMDSLGFYQTSSPVAGDLNGDGRDEILMSVNYQVFNEYQMKIFKNMLVAIDFSRNAVIQVGTLADGSNISSTPWIGDMDNNGKLDIVYCHGTNDRQTYTFDGIQVNRISTDVKLTSPIRWGSYMGSQYNGVFSLKTLSSTASEK